MKKRPNRPRKHSSPPAEGNTFTGTRFERRISKGKWQILRWDDVVRRGQTPRRGLASDRAKEDFKWQVPQKQWSVVSC